MCLFVYVYVSLLFVSFICLNLFAITFQCFALSKIQICICLIARYLVCSFVPIYLGHYIVNCLIKFLICTYKCRQQYALYVQYNPHNTIIHLQEKGLKNIVLLWKFQAEMVLM